MTSTYNANTTLHSAYVLHCRPYRETSVIVDLLTEHDGRVAAIMRGVRTAKSKHRSLLQPFTPLLVSWYGSREMKNLKTVEGAGHALRLSGAALMSGLYLNELLVRLLRAEESHHQLFVYYQQTLQALLQATAQQASVEPVLRNFEYQLLADLGYGFEFPETVLADIDDEESKTAASRFLFSHDSEFVAINGEVATDWQSRMFSASALGAMARSDFSLPATRREAKRLMRLALAPLLGDKPLRSKELFRGLSAKSSSNGDNGA